LQNSIWLVDAVASCWTCSFYYVRY